MTHSADNAGGFDHVPSPPGDDAGAGTCQDVRPLLPEYVRGVLDTATAWRVEWHVAHCSDCEVSLPSVAALPEVLLFDPQLVASIPLADTERHAMRGAVRRAISVTVSSRSRRRGLLVAAAALLAVAVWRGGGRWVWSGSGQPVAPMPDSRSEPSPTEALMRTDPTSAPMLTAVQLATADASAEFRALRDAARELEEALGTARDKTSLYVFRDALEDRRRELESRVVRVTE